MELDDLRKGKTPGIEADVGSCMAQAAVICFEDRDHASGVTMKIDGSFSANTAVQWNALSNPLQAKKSWDPDEATAWGASGVAALLIDELTDYRIVERAKKWMAPGRRTGFDYWLGKKKDESPQPLLQDKARLEVSGIRKGTEADIVSRVREKEAQTTVSDSLEIDAYVAVVEFSAPRSRVKKR